MSLKCFLFHLKSNLISAPNGDIILFGISISSVWIQGIIIERSVGPSKELHLRIDDATDTILVSLIDLQEYINVSDYQIGTDVMIAGAVICGWDPVKIQNEVIIHGNHLLFI